MLHRCAGAIASTNPLILSQLWRKHALMIGSSHFDERTLRCSKCSLLGLVRGQTGWDG
uniref:Uncharacterized protein n=1 Tax=Picea glauca TaxID=3330 RepID=A0A124GNY0_PICGL|nr:hypothetical protein ABT39_MTgene70 [Picea glauca]QHR90763.1 hypothetical protein Q903MT_gene4789 [Picea sitchensis]